MDGPEKMYTTTEVAAIFSVKGYTIVEWIKNGKLKAGQLNGKYRIRESEVKRLVHETYGDTSG